MMSSHIYNWTTILLSVSHLVIYLLVWRLFKKIGAVHKKLNDLDLQREATAVDNMSAEEILRLLDDEDPEKNITHMDAKDAEDAVETEPDEPSILQGSTQISDLALDPSPVYLITAMGSISFEGTPDHPNQDAIAYDESLGKFAIADGVGMSVGQRQWADLLVNEYVQVLTPEKDFTDWIGELKEQWFSSMAPRVEIWKADLVKHQFDLKLFNSTGGSATFLGLEVRKIDGHLEADVIAVGDCCLFIFRNSILQDRYPLCEFTKRPDQISTRVPLESNSILTFSFCLDPGDFVCLATDAVSEFLAHDPVQAHMRARKIQSEREEYLRARAKEGQLAPDDYSILFLEVPR